MIGAEITLPKNNFVDKFVYEYLYTKSQSGPVYHDHTPSVEDQISAVDNYYNHGIYSGWQHWGQAIGNPLYRSPLYRNDGTFMFSSNRFIAHHLVLRGIFCRNCLIVHCIPIQQIGELIASRMMKLNMAILFY